jgi:hypothetical protein
MAVTIGGQPGASAYAASKGADHDELGNPNSVSANLLPGGGRDHRKTTASMARVAEVALHHHDLLVAGLHQRLTSSQRTLKPRAV